MHLASTGRRMLLAAATLAALAPNAFGQSANSNNSDTPDKIKEKNSAIPPAAVVLDQVTIYSTRQSSNVMDVPANISVVDGSTIEKQGISDMMELMRYQPGIVTSFQTSSTDPFNSYGGFVIRGVGGNRVQMLIDGGRVAERGGDSTRDYLDFGFVKQVDIVRGPGGTLWGADALGGIVALETVDPEDVLQGRKRAGHGRLSYDSVDRGSDVSAIFAQRLGPESAFLLGISHSKAEQMRLSKARADGGIWGCPRRLDLGEMPCNRLNPTDKKTNRLLSKLQWQPSSDQHLQFSLDVMQRRMNVDYRNSISKTVHRHDRRQITQRYRLGVEHEWQPNAVLADTVTTRLSWSPYKVDRYGRKWQVNAKGDSINTEDFSATKERFIEFDTQITKTLAAGGAEHNLTWGFDGDLTKIDNVRHQIIHNNTAGTDTLKRPSLLRGATTRRADLYVQDRITLMNNALEVTPGLRLATYDINPRPGARYAYVPGARPTRTRNSSLLGELGLIWQMDNTYSIYAKAAQGFKMPTASQLFSSRLGARFSIVPNPALKPEEVNSYEVGLRGQYGAGNFSANGFYSDYTNFIRSFHNIPGTSNYTNVNLSKVNVWGLEASGNWQFNNQWSASFSLSWQRGSQIAKPGAAKTNHDVTPLVATLGLNYEVPNANLTLGMMGSFATRVKRTSKPDLFKPSGYGVFDAYTNWRISKMATMNLSVLNLFDKRYFLSPMPYAYYKVPPMSRVASANPLELQTQPGRTFRISLEMRF